MDSMLREVDVRSPRTTGSGGRSKASARSVSLGFPGLTPKQMRSYRQSDPPAAVSACEEGFYNNRYSKARNRPQEADSNVVSSISGRGVDTFIPVMITASSYDRPKTSRAKQRPTPDEFTDYVVPSPPPQHKKSVLEHHSSVYVIQPHESLCSSKQSPGAPPLPVPVLAPLSEGSEVDRRAERTRAVAEPPLSSGGGMGTSASVVISSYSKSARKVKRDRDHEDLFNMSLWLFASAFKL